MTFDELMRRLVVAVLAPALGQHVLLVRLQHREPLDFPKVTGEAGSVRHAPVTVASRPMISTYWPISSELVSKQNYQGPTPLSI